MARICVVTAGHLSTCPRMLKAADALAEAGHRVRVVSTRFADWATSADEDVLGRRPGKWAWAVVDYAWRTAPGAYLRSGLRFRASRCLAAALGPRAVPPAVAARAYGRVHPELVRRAAAEPADFLYGGGGALASTLLAAKRLRVPYALDLEDFHSAEQDDSPHARLAHALAERIERAVLPGAAFLSAASAAIAQAYADTYGLRPVVINNTFPLPPAPPDLRPSPGDRLRLYWFSQTVGPNRGLEDVVRAVGLADIAAELHLRGRAIPEYLDGLIRLAQEVASSLKIVHHEPVPPDALVESCGGYDVGLGVEPGFSPNNLIALSNKVFTYLLGGLAIVLTDTPGQRALAADLEAGAYVYKPGDAAGLALGLRRWAADKALLARAKARAWQAAVRRWHWEHPEERGVLLNAVEKVLRP